MQIRITSSVGMLLLAILLILQGLTLFGLSVPAVLPAVLALIAGVLILIGR